MVKYNTKSIYKYFTSILVISIDKVFGEDFPCVIML